MVQGPRRTMRTILAGAAFVHCARRRRRPCPAQGPASRRTDRRGYRARQGADAWPATARAATPPTPQNRSRAESGSIRPFGGIYSPNLTPDRETGLGAWSDDDFYRALRFGVARDGSRYYPAFPYPHFTRLTRQDILAIRAYLATLTPVSNAPRAPELRWPFNYRVVMRGWNWLFLKPGIPDAGPEKSAEWNRGRYLVEGVAHCGSCHTPKNIFGADKTRPDVWRRASCRACRAAAGRRRAQRPEILERGRHHRISAERPQRQKPVPAN